jgi:hypothetical protein
MTTVATFPQQARKPGRPKLGDYTLKCTIPKAALAVLIARETATGKYRTELASRIICEWASKETGKSIRLYH